MPDSYAAKKRITINLKVRTQPMKQSVSSRKITIRLKEESSAKWLYNRTLRLDVRKYKGKYNYSKKSRIIIFPTVGGIVKAEAFVKLDDGRELYKEWDIKINTRIHTYHSTHIMSRYRGEGQKKQKVIEKDDNGLIRVKFFVNGKTGTLIEKVMGNDVVIKLRKKGNDKWDYKTGKKMRQRRSGKGYSYTFIHREKREAEKASVYEVEITSKLSDGREIYASTEARVIMPARILQVYLTMNKFRGVKSESAVKAEKKGETVPVTGTIVIKRNVLAKVKRKKDHIAPGTMAKITILDKSGKPFSELSVPVNVKYGNLEGKFFGNTVNIPLNSDTVTITFEVPTEKGKRVFRKKKVVGFKQISGKKTLWLKLKPNTYR